MKLYTFGGIVVAMFMCFGCMPRAHLKDDTGLSLKRVLALQNSVRPQSKLAPLSAVDSKIIMTNHVAGHSKEGSSKSTASRSSRKSASGAGEIEVGSRPKASLRRLE